MTNCVWEKKMVAFAHGMESDFWGSVTSTRYNTKVFLITRGRIARQRYDLPSEKLPRAEGSLRLAPFFDRALATTSMILQTPKYLLVVRWPKVAQISAWRCCRHTVMHMCHFPLPPAPMCHGTRPLALIPQVRWEGVIRAVWSQWHEQFTANNIEGV